jgi:hypothetical protein
MAHAARGYVPPLDTFHPGKLNGGPFYSLAEPSGLFFLFSNEQEEIRNKIAVSRVFICE